MKNGKTEEDLSKKIVTRMNQEYMLSNIRRIKIVREIGNGTQRRLSTWVS